jgi:D-glucosaminate-6-phosphate ammonia-lyase
MLRRPSRFQRQRQAGPVATDTPRPRRLGGLSFRDAQATGILCGRSHLILSAALQHQDMDVFPETWPHRRLVQEGVLAGPPHHGIGRGFKVGKEEIAGLITALRLYRQRDILAELHQWSQDMAAIASALKGIPGVSANVVFPQANGRPVPNVHVRIDPAVAKIDACAVINKLQEGNPPICVFEKLATSGTVVIMPEALQSGKPIQSLVASGNCWQDPRQWLPPRDSHRFKIMDLS